MFMKHIEPKCKNEISAEFSKFVIPFRKGHKPQFENEKLVFLSTSTEKRQKYDQRFRMRKNSEKF